MGVLELVLNDSAELLEPSLLIVDGVNDAIAPAGRAVALNVTVCAVLPVVKAAVTEDDPDVPPRVAVTEAGFADNVKELALTVNVTVVVCVAVPVPVTVTG